MDGKAEEQVLGGRYRLVAVLGEGGMGTVCEAVNTWTERHVAVKLLRVDTVLSETVIQRFLREGKLAGRLEHRNVVQVLDMGQTDDGSLYIVQELLRGTDLRRWLQGRSCTVAEALAVVLPIAEALIAAHAVALVHRDVKPENIFLSNAAGSDEVTPKLIDFGIALDAKTDARLTASGATIGTASYMSPEQARGADEVSAASDVWSLGAVLFELLTGRVPYVGNTYNVVIAKLLTEAPPRADTIDPSMDAVLADIVERALARELSSRFSDMRAFRDALAQWAEEHGVRPASLRLDERDRAPAPRPITAQDVARFSRSNPAASAHPSAQAALNSWVSSPTQPAQHTEEISEPRHVTEAVAPAPTHSTLTSSITRERASEPRSTRPWFVAATALLVLGSIASVAIVGRGSSSSTARAAQPDAGIALARPPRMPVSITEADASPTSVHVEPPSDASATPSQDAAAVSDHPRVSATHNAERPMRSARDAGRSSEPTNVNENPSTSAAGNGANGSPLLPPE